MAIENGQKVDVYVGDKKIGETTTRSIILTEKQSPDFDKWDYYYRRGNKYFFRRWGQRLTFETSDIRMRQIPRCKVDINYEVDTEPEPENGTLTYPVDLSAYKKLK